MGNRATLALGRVTVPNSPPLTTSPETMARKKKADDPPPHLGPSPPRRESSPEEKLTLVYMDWTVHKGFLRKEHAQYIKVQGFGDLSLLLWSDERFRPDQLYQFTRNFDTKEEATMVDGRVISLDREILAMIFRVPEGPNKVELWLSNVQSATYQPTGFHRRGHQQERLLLEEGHQPNHDGADSVSEVCSAITGEPLGSIGCPDLPSRGCQAQGLVVLPSEEAAGCPSAREGVPDNPGFFHGC